MRPVKYFALAAMLVSSVVSAQVWRQGRARLEGTVRDAQGKPIADAVVKLRLHEVQQGPDVKTNKSGYWAILGLNGGLWDIDVTAPGYQTFKTSINAQEFSRNPPIEVSLKPAVTQQPQEEFSVGGKKISKDAAEAIKKGNDAWNAKDWATARAQYEIALKELPDNAGLLEHAEMACYEAKQYDDALAYAKKVTVADPTDTNSWLLIAELELQKGNLEEGKAALEKVPDEKIVDPGPYLNMGINYYNKGKAADAEQWFTKAIDKKPNAADNADAYFYRGLARYNLKRPDEARTDLQTYLQLAPTGSNAETAKELIESMKGKPAAHKPVHKPVHKPHGGGH